VQEKTIYQFTGLPIGQLNTVSQFKKVSSIQYSVSSLNAKIKSIEEMLVRNKYSRPVIRFSSQYLRMKILKDYLEKNKGIKSINLVTSKYHSARARMIFEKAVRSFDRNIEIYIVANKYDTFNAEQWWKDRESFKQVILEYLKLINFYLREQFLL
jgi:hypothetical protein